MKHIPFVADIHLEMPTGVKFTDPSDPNKPVMIKQLAFLCELTTVEAFGEGMKPWDAADLAVDVRTSLRRQDPTVLERGHWELDDEPARRLLMALEKMTPQGDQRQIFFNYVPFARALRKQTTPPEAVDSPANAATLAS